METWNAPLSIFAPLILGVPDETNGPKVDKLLGTAASLVPKTTTPYAVKRRGSFTKSRQVWTRQVVYYVGNAARPHVMRVRLLDVPPDKTIQEVGIGSAMWEVTLDLLPAGSANPAIPPDRAVAFLNVTLLTKDRGGLRGGPQLALLRHLFVSGTAAHYPDLVVVGGQRDWSDDWWQESTSTEGAD